MLTASALPIAFRHYTCHTKSVITKPQNVFVMRDILCAGYVAGGNTKFFGMTDKDTAPDFTKNPTVVADDIQKRLSFEMGADDEYGSLLAFAVPYGDGAKRDMVMSISDRVLPWEVNMVQADRKYFPGGADGYAAYRTRYGLGQIHYGEDIRASETQEFISQGSVNNSLLFVGPHRVYSPWSNTFYELVPGQGHFGPDALPGDARYRRGEAISAAAARKTMVSVEAAAHSALIFNNAKP